MKLNLKLRIENDAKQYIEVNANEINLVQLEKVLKTSQEALTFMDKEASVLVGETITDSSLKTITITFPELNAKDIVDECDNKVGEGKLVYGEWYKDEDFYTKETTRPGTRVVNLELLHKGKSWNEIKNMGMEDNMLNFAEVVYLLRESIEFRTLLTYESDKDAWWTWTSSRASDGDLVGVGSFDSDGVRVDNRSPDFRYDYLGVSFSAVNQ